MTTFFSINDQSNEISSGIQQQSLFDDSEFFEHLIGKVVRVSYRAALDGGWTVLSLQLSGRAKGKNGSSTVKVVGEMPYISDGEEVSFDGKWVNDPKYGWQFRAERVEIKTSGPGDPAALTAYLASGMFPGVGEARASSIVTHFGELTAQVIEETPEKLADVSGITSDMAAEIGRIWKDHRESREAIAYLIGYGISVRIAMRIWHTYGRATLARVKENPYRLAEDVDGIGFYKADEIARKIGVPFDSPFRYEAACIHTLKDACGSDGHCYLPHLELVRRAADLLKVSDLVPVGEAVTRLIAAKRVVLETISIEPVYLPGMYNSEVDSAKRLLALATSNRSAVNERRNTDEISPDDDEPGVVWDHILDGVQSESNFRLTHQQRSAVLTALTHNVSVITGGPGTGKTATIRMLIACLERARRTFILCAPTGRAGKRMSESTGRPAATIHRTLGYKPGRDDSDGVFWYNEKNPLDVDMIIVDEVSMCDLWLFHQLLKALPHSVHLVLVGDVDQLPAVGAGNVLSDVIVSGVIPVTRLNTIFRQSDKSQIVVSAHRINHGEMPNLNNDSDDFFFFTEDDPAAAATLVVDIVTKRIPQKFGFDPLHDIQVLAPMYRGACGVDVLNGLLQTALNPANWGKQEYSAGKGRVFREGDKVLMTKNSAEKGVFNGDTGFITKIDRVGKKMSVQFGEDRVVEFELSDLSCLTHGYALSVHKSQGSEYPCVVIPILSSFYIMLRRRLLYTAVTRARRLCVLVGETKAVGMAVHNDREDVRWTLLAERLAGEV